MHACLWGAVHPAAHLSSGTSRGPKVSYSVRVPMVLTRAAGSRGQARQGSEDERQMHTATTKAGKVCRPVRRHQHAWAAPRAAAIMHDTGFFCWSASTLTFSAHTAACSRRPGSSSGAATAAWRRRVNPKTPAFRSRFSARSGLTERPRWTAWAPTAQAGGRPPPRRDRAATGRHRSGASSRHAPGPPAPQPSYLAGPAERPSGERQGSGLFAAASLRLPLQSGLSRSEAAWHDRQPVLVPAHRRTGWRCGMRGESRTLTCPHSSRGWCDQLGSLIPGVFA